MRDRWDASGRLGGDRMRIVWALVLIVIACGLGNGSENSLRIRPSAETLYQLAIQEGESHSGKWNRLAHSWKLIPDEGEFRMFHAAAWRDDADIITELAVGRRLFLDARDDKGYAPLHYAAIYDARRVISELIIQGANIEVTDNHGSTPLHTAVHNFSRGAAAELIMRGANVHATDKYGRTRGVPKSVGQCRIRADIWPHDPQTAKPTPL